MEKQKYLHGSKPIFTGAKKEIRTSIFGAFLVHEDAPDGEKM